MADKPKDKQARIKRLIDEKQPSYERKLALLFLLAMPESVEKNALKTAYETLAKHRIEHLPNVQIAITSALLAAATREIMAMAVQNQVPIVFDDETPPLQ